jgi:uncharacterized protein YqjF (DUF2071 family)
MGTSGPALFAASTLLSSAGVEGAEDGERARDPLGRDAPRPAGSWAVAMRWHDLLFLHWPVAAELLQPLLPAGVELDRFEGRAWIGVVPFRMSGVRPRGVPGLPGASGFPELNVRTYVTCRGRPGVWFLSLDAASAAAVRGARARFHLPYFHARMRCVRRGEWIEYESERRDARAPAAAFAARWRPLAPPSIARPGSLEHFLTARWRLFAATPDGRVRRGEIEHAPWPLQPAECVVERDTSIAAHGLPPPGGPPLLHFARRLDVAAWALEPA